MGIVFGPITICLGVQAKREIRDSSGRIKGDRLALAGIINGSVGLVFGIVVLIYCIVVFVGAAAVATSSVAGAGAVSTTLHDDFSSFSNQFNDDDNVFANFNNDDNVFPTYGGDDGFFGG